LKERLVPHLWPVTRDFTESGDVEEVEPELYMLLRFQKAIGGNYETGNQAFSMHLRFLTIRGAIMNKGLWTLQVLWGVIEVPVM
jgi:hypothetical protein